MRVLKMLSTVALAGALALSAHAQTPAPDTGGSAAEQLAADPLNTSAPYAFIMDGDSGQTLYCKSCETPVVPASMSKLMVYYLVFERIKEGRLKLSDEFKVSEHAWRTGGAGTEGSTMFLELGSKVSVENLLRGAIIQSGNDACIVLAEGIAGSEEAFAREMTARAAALGMKNSHFANVTGLDDPGQRMSVADIGRIGYHLIKDFPEFYPMFSEREFTWNGIRQPNRNPLLREMDGADGIKTGHLSVSGFGLVGSAVRDGKRRIIVLQGLGSESERRKEGPRVMRAAFNDFRSEEVVAPGAQVATADVWLGEEKSVPLVVADGVTIGAHIDALKSARSIVHYKGPLYAPVKKGDVVGELVVTIAGAEPVTVPVTAGADVSKLGLVGRAMVGLRGE
ncbi:MAG: D-alanyl-D-alanine carboxypeptidase family protein [Hyphomonadaceae bacterium]